MSADLVSGLTPWLVVGLALVLAAVAFAVLSARSLFAMSVLIAAVGALAAVIVFAAGAGDAAIALAAFGVGLAPVLLLAGVLLSARAIKQRRTSLPWMHAVAIAAGVAGVALIAPELDASAGAAESPPPALWLAALVFVVAIGCAGLLGYGDRGVLERRPPVIEP